MSSPVVVPEKVLPPTTAVKVVRTAQPMALRSAGVAASEP
jgi:hypothetical protein